MTVKEALKNFSKLYLITLAVTLIILTSGALIYAAIMNKPLSGTIRGALIIGALVLIGIGFVSLLPFSEYRYIRGGALNPAIAREGMRHIRAGRDPKRMGIILGFVGFTLLLIYFAIFQ
ncbi:MAG: hypothetical protein QXH40_00605 [Candidatus Bathyarchaeia archaeon]